MDTCKDRNLHVNSTNVRFLNPNVDLLDEAERILYIKKEITGRSSPRFVSMHPIGVIILRQMVRGIKSQERAEFIHGQTCFTNDRSQSPSGYFSMIRNDHTSIRFSIQSQDHVASSLTIEFIADLSQCVDNIAS